MQVRFHLFDDPCAIKDLAEYDIAILDIDMGDFSGIDLAWRLRKEKPGIVIIFLTNFIQYAPEGFEVQAFRYLLKTNMQERLVSYFEDAVKEVVRKKQSFLFSVRNTTLPVEIKNDTIQTTKPNASLHGFGLSNIKLILNKYHADFVMDYEDGWFQFTGEIEAQVRK